MVNRIHVETCQVSKNMGTEGLEPSRLAAHDPKSCLSASSSTSPGLSEQCGRDYKREGEGRQQIEFGEYP